METDERIEWLAEQLAAAEESLHLYKCCVCQIATPTKLVVLVDIEDPNNTAIQVLGVCDTCQETE